MTKKKSIVKLCIISVLTLIGLFLTFFSFVIPTTNTTFKGFFNAINYGYDVDGGVLAIYKPYDDTLAGHDLENKVTTTVANLSSITSNIAKIMDDYNKLEDDEKLKLKSTVKDVLTITKNVKKFSEKLNKRFLLFRLMF